MPCVFQNKATVQSLQQLSITICVIPYLGKVLEGGAGSHPGHPLRVQDSVQDSSQPSPSQISSIQSYWSMHSNTKQNTRLIKQVNVRDRLGEEYMHLDISTEALQLKVLVGTSKCYCSTMPIMGATVRRCALCFFF